MKKEKLHNLKRLAFMIMLFVLGGQVSSKAQCSANFTVTYDSTGSVLEFFPTWTSSANVLNMTWSFGDGTSSNAQQPTHAYNYNGYALVCYTISFSDSCQASHCDTVLTRQAGTANCVAGFSYNSAPTGVVFTNNSYSNDSITTYAWDFGDGTTDNTPNPVHAYTTFGTYTVCLTITSFSGCSDTYCNTLVNQNPAAVCNVDFSSSPVLGTTLVNFTDLSIADSGATIVSYSWNFGDSIGTSTSQNPTYNYGSPGNYYACLSIVTSSGCTSSYCLPVTSGANACMAYWSASFNPASNAIDFVDYSTTNDTIIRWDWTFGDGTTSSVQNPNHIYNSVGVYSVCLTITTASGCTTNYCSTVSYAGPQNCSAAFSGISSASSLGNFFATYSNASAQYFWAFGDGTYANGVGLSSTTHQFATAGTYIVCMAVQDSLCADSTCITFTTGTSTACAALYTFALDTTGMVYTFTNQSTAATNYFWSFGDGTSSTDPNPVHIYNSVGPHTVCLTLVDSTTGCTDTYCNAISAANACSPVFVALPDSSSPAGTPMNFTVITPCGTPVATLIDYGDGSNPQVITGITIVPYTYTISGAYNVCVSTVDAMGDTTYACDTIVAYRLASGIADLELSNIQLSAYPNPFSSTLNSEFTLERNAVVSMQLIGIAGNVVRSTEEVKLSAGTHRETIKTDDLASGFYILRLNVNGMQVSKKVALQK